MPADTGAFVISAIGLAICYFLAYKIVVKITPVDDRFVPPRKRIPVGCIIFLGPLIFMIVYLILMRLGILPK